MLNVLDVLSLPLFKDFRLVTDNSGLYNEISDAKLYEDIGEKSIPDIYKKGVFIILSPSILRAHPKNSHDIMLALLERQPAAISIKDVQFNSLPEDLISRANALHVPIFFFSETFLDEILYSIKNALTPHEINTLNVSRMAKILYDPMTENQIEYMAREINPLFYKNVICAFCIPKNQDNIPNDTTMLFEQYLRTSHANQKQGKYAYSLLKWPRGIGFLYTSGARPEDLRNRLIEKLQQSGMDLSMVSIGISNPYSELRNLKKAFHEALHAAIDALLSGDDTKNYAQVGLVGFLAPFRNDEWTDIYYNNLHNRLYAYDKANESNLMQTLLSYVRNGGNIAKTADATFQHSNTIRYRLEKIKTVMGIQDAPDADIQLYLFIRLHEIKKLLL
jgi:PucR C-terminal helix-turn-helix domain/Purine catabolism regulatory protein-like family/GGDEF-like domain